MFARHRPRRRGGFTLLEMAVSGALSGTVAALLAAAWPAFDRAATEVAMRARLAQEADLALNRIAQDLAGVGPDGRRALGALSWSLLDDDGDGEAETHFALYQGDLWTDSDAPDGPLTVTYRLDPGLRVLERLGGDAVAPELVARHVAALRVRELPSPWIEVELELLHPGRVPGARPARDDLRRTYTLIACLP